MVSTPTVATEQVIIDWVRSLGWDDTPEVGYVLSPGPEIHENPDRIVFITGTGGPGYVTDEASADEGSFQARVRGPSDDVLAAQLAAQQLDALILGAALPVMVDGVPILRVSRMGGQPVPLPLDPGDRRFEFTCNYLIVTGV